MTSGMLALGAPTAATERMARGGPMEIDLTVPGGPMGTGIAARGVPMAAATVLRGAPTVLVTALRGARMETGTELPPAGPLVTGMLARGGPTATGTAARGGLTVTGRTAPGAAMATGLLLVRAGRTMAAVQALARPGGTGPSRAGTGTEVVTARVASSGAMTADRARVAAASVALTPVLPDAVTGREAPADGPVHQARIVAPGAGRGRTATDAAGDRQETPADRVDRPTAPAADQRVVGADRGGPTDAVSPLCPAAPAGEA